MPSASSNKKIISCIDRIIEIINTIIAADGKNKRINDEIEFLEAKDIINKKLNHSPNSSTKSKKKKEENKKMRFKDFNIYEVKIKFI